MDFKDKVLLSSESKNKLRVLYRVSSLYYDEDVVNKIENGDLELRHYVDIEERIKEKIERYKEYLPENLDDKLYNEYTNLLKLCDTKTEVTIDDLNDKCIEESIDLYYKIYNYNKTLYMLRDLIKTKHKLLTNMKYYKTEEEINDFIKIYDEAIKNRDINKMKQLLENENNNVLNEWNKLDTDLDKMNDDNFCFIGHSTGSIKFNRDFYTKYISCSLYNKDVNDTYRCEFGLIFKPKNIMSAR